MISVKKRSLILLTQNLYFEYGVDHGIKFNQYKCELIVFINSYKRTKAMSTGDEWQGEIILNGKTINQVSTIKYLGIMISKKKMLGLKQRNYSRHLFNAVKIGHTKRFIKKMKMQFYIKLNENEFTRL